MSDDDGGTGACPPTLETDRLLLRPWRVSDAPTMRLLWMERDRLRVPPHRLIDADGHPDIQDLEDRISDGRYSTAYGLGLPAVELKTTGEVVGYVGVIANDHGTADEPEIAYELLRRFRGQGYATEAGSAVVAWARAAGFRRLWASVRDWNIESFRVLDKLGFVDSGRVEPDETYGDTRFITKEL